MGVGFPETAAGFLLLVDLPASGLAGRAFADVPETVFPVCFATVFDVAGLAGVGFVADVFFAGALAGGVGSFTAGFNG